MKYIHSPNTPQETELTEQIYDEWNAAIFTRQELGVEEEWVKAEQYWAGDTNPPEDDDDPASNTNIVQPNIESQVADLVDDNMDINVNGYTKSDDMYVEKAKSMLVWTWDNNEMLTKIDAHERSRLNLGTGVWKVGYDPDLGVNGLVTMYPEPVETVAIDPKITDPLRLQEADYIIQASPKSLKYLRKRFGKRAKAVLPESVVNFSVPGLSEEDAQGAEEIARNKAILFERWTKEYDEKTQTEYLRLVYMANHVVLFDSEWPDAKKQQTTMPFASKSFYEHGLYPFVVIPCYRRKGSIYGYGDTKFLIPIQDLINDFDDQIRYNARLMGNIQVVVGLASGINSNTWTPTPGLRIPARDPNAFKIVQPPPIPSYIPERRNQGFKEAEIIVGRPDVVEGQSSGGVDAASAIIALQEAGNRRVKHKKKMAAQGYKQLLKLVYQFCLEFYTEDQAFPVENDQGQKDYMFFNPQSLNEIPQLYPEIDEETGYLSGWAPQYEPMTDDEENNDEEAKPITKRAEFNISLSVGQGLPNNKAFIYQAIIELKHADLVTREEGRVILQKMLGFTGFNPLNPIGLFDGPPNNQFKNTSPYSPNAGAGLGALTNQPMPPQQPQVPQNVQPTMPMMAQPQAAPNIDMNNPIIQQIMAALMGGGR